MLNVKCKQLKCVVHLPTSLIPDANAKEGLCFPKQIPIASVLFQFLIPLEILIQFTLYPALIMYTL